MSDLSRSKLLKAAFVVVAIIAGKELVSHLPEDSASMRPFEVTGEVREDVSLRTGTVRVTQVQLSPTLLTPSQGYRTPGLWVVATVTLVPASERESLTFTAIRSADGERTWSGRSRSSGSCLAAPPGVPITCDVAFEVPGDALPGADLLVATETDQRYDTMAVIDLGITAEDVAAAEDAEPASEKRSRLGDGDG